MSLRLFAGLLSLALVACQPQTRSQQSIQDNDRGVALMGQFDYKGAAEVFEALVESEPDWVLARVNLAIATLNRQLEGDEDRALALARAVVAEKADHLDAHYVIALLSFNRGDCATAVEHFETVRTGDPKDAYAAYFLAQCKVQQGDAAGALALYQSAIDLDPYLRSAYYGAFQAYQRLGDREQATAMLDSYQRLDNNPRARLAEIKYTKMGPRATARVAAQPTEPRTFQAAGPLLVTEQPLLPGQLGTVSSITSAYANYPGGDRMLLVGGQSARLWRESDSQWVEDTVPFAPFDIAAWGDFDNDGATDVYLANADQHQLWQATDLGWSEQTAQLPDGVIGSADAMWLDADHDGDLDLLTVDLEGQIELFNNDRDGSFRKLAADYLPAIAAPVKAVAASDIDGDRDTDLVLLQQDGSLRVLINDRLWQYRDAGLVGDWRFAMVTPIDLDADGQFDIIGITEQGKLTGLSIGSDGAWHSPRELGLSLAELGDVTGLGLVDLDGDGAQEILVSAENGWRVAKVDEAATLIAEGPHSMATYLVNHDGSITVIGISAENQLIGQTTGTGRGPAVAIALTGLEDTGQGMRSNASGYGTRVAVRNGGRWTVAEMYRLNPGPGQSQLPLSVGLAGNQSADFVAVDWSDGVYQTELDIPAGKVSVVTETQRQLASCPVLFAWDGTKYRFVSDVLGVGGIGFAVGPGQYAEPRPWEYFQLPHGLSQPRLGHYQFKLAEPMEEVAYVDQVQLHVFDLPPGWRMVMDERMGTASPLPTGQPLFYQQQTVPIGASVNGNTALAEMIKVDGRAVDPGPDDPRFAGLLEKMATIDFELAEPVDVGVGKAYLRFDGWVEYGYSQTSFAAWQAGLSARSLSLYGQDAAGQWQLLLENFGYPAGMPRAAVVPLPKTAHGKRMFRLTTNQQVYLDQVSVLYAQGAPEQMRHSTVSLSKAQVNRVGFAQRSNFDLKRPHYDYDQRATFWDTRYPQGAYTALGDALALLHERDNATAIIGPGDEVHLEFPVSATAQLPAGWRRELVLEFRGWAKDMDLYTRDGETVHPLPSDGAVSIEAKELQQRYTTRFQAGKS
ncbi:MAG: hypothetical protein DHS20C11_17460 [Lysobacteraceae bacterium]|nr:MAG: hypothetical protein DHS20C11_17460 [Xanthomonadaceae bacterium]